MKKVMKNIGMKIRNKTDVDKTQDEDQQRKERNTVPKMKPKEDKPSEHKDVIRNVRTNKHMIMKYGPTVGCKGCLTATAGYVGNHPHNDTCRWLVWNVE